jgi:tRNA pseudouridine38-40 synthase
MNQAAKILTGYSDFTSFSRLHSDVKTNICRIYEAKWTDDEGRMVFTIRADRFLRNMVRAIVGTLVKVGLQKIGISDFAKIIESRNRGNAGPSAPAKGLFLEEIEYPEEIFI